MATYVFPGQGSQSKGMGASLFAEFPDHVQSADTILGYSIKTLCVEDPDNQLNNTEYTQPALYVVSVLSYLKKLQENPTPPTYVAGHSVGEYAALFAAKVFDFETGLKLVQKRGALMSQARDGGMAAVVGLTAEAVQALLEKHGLKEITIANYNSLTQVVLTGSKDQVNSVGSLFKEAGAMLFMPLKVSGAFHSKWMEEAQQQFAAYLKTLPFNRPTIQVIANVTARPYPADDIYTNLSIQMTHSVHWTQTIQYLLAQGETLFEEIGPGKVLSGLIARIQKGQ